MTTAIAKNPFIPEILVLDDDPAFRNRFKELLSGEGFTSQVTGSETKAFNILLSPGVRVLIQNFTREPSTMGACKFTAALRENPATREIPVILITHTERSVIGDAFREADLDWNREITALIPKPNTLDEAIEIAAMLRSLLDVEL